MLVFRTLILTFLLSSGLALQPATAQDMNLQPKYGWLSKNDAQKAADAKFIAIIDVHYKGARGRLAAEVFQFGPDKKVTKAFAHYAL
jgi:hypothetical protein